MLRWDPRMELPGWGLPQDGIQEDGRLPWMEPVLQPTTVHAAASMGLPMDGMYREDGSSWMVYWKSWATLDKVHTAATYMLLFPLSHLQVESREDVIHTGWNQDWNLVCYEWNEHLQKKLSQSILLYSNKWSFYNIIRCHFYTSEFLILDLTWQTLLKNNWEYPNSGKVWSLAVGRWYFCKGTLWAKSWFSD
jgi:hypothetical protein